MPADPPLARHDLSPSRFADGEDSRFQKGNKNGKQTDPPNKLQTIFLKIFPIFSGPGDPFKRVGHVLQFFVRRKSCPETNSKAISSHFPFFPICFRFFYILFYHFSICSNLFPLFILFVSLFKVSGTSKSDPLRRSQLLTFSRA